MIQAFVNLSQEWAEDFSKSFVTEIQLLRGSVIFGLFEPIESDNEKKPLSSAQS